MSSGITDTAHESSQPAEPDTNCIQGINQVVLVLQPDDSTQYMLLSEERALREAAAKQAALEAEEQGLVRLLKPPWSFTLRKMTRDSLIRFDMLWAGLRPSAHPDWALQLDCAVTLARVKHGRRSHTGERQYSVRLLRYTGQVMLRHSGPKVGQVCCRVLCSRAIPSSASYLQVPVDPRDAAIMQAIEDGDAAVRRVFQERWLASLNRQFQCPGDLQPSEGAHQR